MTESAKSLNGNKLAESDILLADRIEDRDTSTEDGCVLNRINVCGNTDNGFCTEQHILSITPIHRNAVYCFILTHLEEPALA